MHFSGSLPEPVGALRLRAVAKPCLHDAPPVDFALVQDIFLGGENDMKRIRFILTAATIASGNRAEYRTSVSSMLLQEYTNR